MTSLRTLLCASLLFSGCAPTPAPTAQAPISLAVHPASAASPLPSAAQPTTSSTPAPARSSAEPTDDELIEKYTPVWRALLAKKNSVSVADVERGVAVTTRSIQRLAGFGIMFQIVYSLKLEWASASAHDSFLVRFDPQSKQAAALFPGMTDRWFSQAEIESLPDGPFGGKATRMPIGKHLKYASLADAMKALPGTSGAKFNEEGRVFLPRAEDIKNDLYLEARSDLLPGRKTDCLSVRLNLVTGEVQRSKESCGPRF